MRKTPFVEARIMQALSHPIRSEILRLLASEETLSPQHTISLLSSSEMISLGQVNYHVWFLDRDGLVEPAGVQPGLDKGIVYRATAKGRQVMTLIGVRPSEGPDT
jgi:DNA-binding transcriptional ArsR family regulator